MTAPNLPAPWREIPADATPADGAEVLTWSATTDGTMTVRRWTLTPPPALPAALGSTIRIEGVVWTLESMGWRAAGSDTVTPASDLTPAAFDVLAVPPSATATAVLADVRAATIAAGIGTIDLTPIAEQYGASLPPAALL